MGENSKLFRPSFHLNFSVMQEVHVANARARTHTHTCLKLKTRLKFDFVHDKSIYLYKKSMNLTQTSVVIKLPESSFDISYIKFSSVPKAGVKNCYNFQDSAPLL